MEQGQQRYAGFWIRVLAGLIDLVVMGIVIYVPLTLIYGAQYWESEDFIAGFWDAFLGYVVPFVGTIWFWRTFLGTPGKMALKLRVVDADTGDRLTIPQSVGRYFAYIPAMLFLCLGLFWIGFSSRKQGWHDKLAGTVVLRG
ncbi:MAG TPA: RDD family protein [Ramlibacter sp.]|nr:RDD family protein [Ramlibacter sp.]